MSPMRFRDLRSFVDRSTLRTPEGTRSASSGLFPCPRSAHPTDRPPCSRRSSASSFHGHCHYEDASPLTSPARFRAGDPCPGFSSVPRRALRRDLISVQTHCSGVCSLHPATRRSSRRALAPLPLDAGRSPGFRGCHDLCRRLRGFVPGGDPSRCRFDPFTGSSPLQVHPSSGDLPTPLHPGSPKLSTRDVLRRSLRKPMAATLAFSVF